MLDFYCAAEMLAVEVDGARHWIGEAQQIDRARDAWLAERGIRTVRISARLIADDLETALRAIAAAV